MSDLQIVDFALNYARHGWRVFPVKARDKTPLIKDWDERATTEENMIAGWWEQWPDANVGIATGAGSGIYVLDVDGEEGAATLRKLQEEHPNQWPVTPIALTGKGWHYVFAYPGPEARNSAKKLGPGLDTRGDGGYIVAPPSVHPSGKVYAWHKDFRPSVTPLVQPPKWMLAMLAGSPVADRPESSAGTDGVFNTGERNNALTRLGGSMRRKGMGFDAILAALLSENRDKCVPPLPEMEVRVIAESVSRYDGVAAPMMEARDRVQAEWSFCRSIYLCPEYVKDFLWLAPEKFADEKLAKFWEQAAGGTELVDAATKSGILADIERYECDVFKVDAYARQVEHFAYLEKVGRLAYRLQKEAGTGDYGRIDNVVNEIVRNTAPRSGKKSVAIADVADELDKEIGERAKNPVEVWGIPYSPTHSDNLPQFSWAYLSKLTGGKQLGELTILAGEPGVGKSWWAIQDALLTAVRDIPVFIWSGEMKRKQLLRRMYAILGVNGQHMKNGQMTEEDWDMLADAKALVLNSPIYISDDPGIELHDLKARIYRERQEHGIQQFLVDYAYLVTAPGKDETERTAVVSREAKIICGEGDGLAGTLIASVTKTGMDITDKVFMGGVRGSGQQSHDADIVYYLTKFAPVAGDAVTNRYPEVERGRLVTLHIVKGRELPPTLVGNRLHFSRIGTTAAFQEERQ